MPDVYNTAGQRPPVDTQPLVTRDPEALLVTLAQAGAGSFRQDLICQAFGEDTARATSATIAACSTLLDTLSGDRAHLNLTAQQPNRLRGRVGGTRLARARQSRLRAACDALSVTSAALAVVEIDLLTATLELDTLARTAHAAASTTHDLYLAEALRERGNDLADLRRSAEQLHLVITDAIKQATDTLRTARATSVLVDPDLAHPRKGRQPRRGIRQPTQH